MEINYNKSLIPEGVNEVVVTNISKDELVEIQKNYPTHIVTSWARDNNHNDYIVKIKKESK